MELCSLWRIDKRILAQFDYITIIFILPLIFISHWLIADAVPALGHKHTAYVFFSILAFIGIVFLPVRRLKWIIPIIYWFNIILLLAVEVVGHSRLGAKRWIEIPFINATIQPSEFVKPALVLMLAYIISRFPPPPEGYRLKEFLKISTYILIPFVLIAKEPDLGTGLVLLLIGYGTLFIVGVHWKIWASVIVGVMIMIPLAYTELLHDYQKQRIKDFVGEKPSYHVQQSIIAIGSGGWTGKIKDEATQTQMKFLPIATSDFIFANLVERTGFLGAFLVIGIYAILIVHLVSVGNYHQDYFIKVITSAIGLMIFVYMSVNIAMTMGLAPVVGVPLPMFSYGGSSFFNFIILFAIMENLIAFRFRDLYENRGTKSFL
jgi:rod shape determining protein RodA